MFVRRASQVSVNTGFTGAGLRSAEPPLNEAEAQPPILPQRVSAIADDMGAMAVLVMSGRHLAYLPDHLAEPYIRDKSLMALNPSLLSYDVPFRG